MAQGNTITIEILGTLDPKTKANIEKQLGKIKAPVKTTRGMKNLNKETKLFSQNIVDAARKFGEWLIVGNVILGTITAIKKGIDAVVQLDTALVELRKVNDEVTSSQNAFIESAKETGEVVGQTTSEIVQATSEFARMGFTLSESLNLAEQAGVLVNISDGINSITDASSSLISILKGFNLDASETGNILDKLNEVSNNYAVQTSDLTGAMSKVSATLSAQNNDLDESIALITAANEVMQDYSRVATGVRTISLRITGVDENNEEIDGLTSTLQKYFDEYETGVKVMNEATGEFNSTYDILVQLSKTWATLTAEQRSNLSELLAG